MKYYDIILIGDVICSRDCKDYISEEVIEALKQNIEDDDYQWVFKPIEVTRYKKGIRLRTTTPPFSYYLEGGKENITRFCIVKALGLHSIRAHIDDTFGGRNKRNSFPRKWRINLGIPKYTEDEKIKNEAEEKIQKVRDAGKKMEQELREIEERKIQKIKKEEEKRIQKIKEADERKVQKLRKESEKRIQKLKEEEAKRLQKLNEEREERIRKLKEEQKREQEIKEAEEKRKQIQPKQRKGWGKKPRGLKIGFTCNTLNELELTKDHLKSLIDNTPWVDKIVVVDAPPPDKGTATREWLREFVKKKGKIEKVLIELDKRWWLNYASNRGIEQLLDCDYIITSNNDNFFRLDWLEPLIKIMEKDKSIGWMSPLTCDKDWNVISMGRNDFDELLWFSLDNSDLLVPVLSTEGSVNVYRKEALEDMKNDYGYYDERVLRRIEMDLGIRFWEKGWKIMMSPASAMIHLVSYSIKKHRTDRLDPNFTAIVEDHRKGWGKYTDVKFWNSLHPKKEVLEFKEKLRAVQKTVDCKIIKRSLYLPKRLQMKFAEPKFEEEPVKKKVDSTVGISLPVGLFSPILKECIEALRQQTYKNWRCLIIADAPDKEFLDYLLLIRKEEERIDLLIHNYLVKDIVRLKNIGLKYFDVFPYTLYLTDDLVMRPDCLEKMVMALDEHPEYGVISPTLAFGPYMARFVCVGDLYSKECIEKVGVMDLQFSPCHQEEHDHMLMIREKGFEPHRVINAVMEHRKFGKGTLAKIHGKKFMSYRDSHHDKICKKHGLTIKEIGNIILNFPAITMGERDKKRPEVAWLASNNLNTLYGGCMVAATNSIIGLNKLGINIKPYQFPYEKIVRHQNFDVGLRTIKDLIDVNRTNFDLVKEDKSNVKCDILIEYHGPPEPMKDSDKHYNILWTTWESTQIDLEKVKILNTADEIWVPSNFTREIMKKSGVNIPIYVMPLGFNPKVFRPNVRPRSVTIKGFVFLYVGDYERRKGLDLFIKAFNEEFKNDDNVFALLHLKEDFGKKIPIENPKIRIVRKGNFSFELFQMPQLYASGNCLVLPSRGEAFAFSAMEALACGLPVIYTNWGGQTDFLSSEIAYPVKYKLVKILESSVLSRNPKAKYAEVLISDLRKQMRHVYENYDEAKKKAEKGRKILLENWTWDHVCQKMSERLKTIWENRNAVAQ